MSESEGEFKKRIRKQANYSHNRYWCALEKEDVEPLIDEAKREFGDIVLVQSLGKRDDLEETHYLVDKKYWKRVLKEKADGKHGEAWFEFKNPDKALTAFLKWFGSAVAGEKENAKK